MPIGRPIPFRPPRVTRQVVPGTWIWMREDFGISLRGMSGGVYFVDPCHTGAGEAGGIVRISLAWRQILTLLDGATAALLAVTFGLIAWNWQPLLRAHSGFRDAFGYHEGHQITAELSGWMGMAAAVCLASMAMSYIWSGKLTGDPLAAERHRASLVVIRFLTVFLCFCATLATLAAARR